MSYCASATRAAVSLRTGIRVQHQPRAIWRTGQYRKRSSSVHASITADATSLDAVLKVRFVWNQHTALSD